MREASDILRSLRDLGWPLLAYLIAAPIATFVVPSRRSPEERAQRLLLVGKMIATVVGLFFVSIEGGNIIYVMRVRPQWGVYVLFLLALGLGIVVRWAVDRVRENRSPLSVTGSNAESPRRTQGRSYVAAVGVWLAASVVAVVWLSRIAGQ
jgi:hypothetical protein